jgi:hypothetical protein
MGTEFHICFSWISIRLHNKNQLRGLPGSAKNVMGPGVVWWWWWWWCGGGGVGFLPIIIPP